MDHLDRLGFTQEICLTYLKKYTQRQQMARPLKILSPVQSRVKDGVQYDGLDHYCCAKEKQSRCAQCKKMPDLCVESVE